MIEFPKDFFWGAATSAYQVEGNNTNSDWWEWESRVGLKQRCGQACRHYELYEHDFDLARALNHNAHRLSVEWSRIEPQQGQFSTDELQHYRNVILALKERGLEPVVTLHHFTNPVWFAKLGGFGNKKAAGYFLAFVEKVVSALCDKVRFWVTLNEPMVYIYHAYILGVWPPQEKSLFKAKAVADNLILAHTRAYQLIHGIYKKRNLPSPMVSIAKNTQAFKPCIVNVRNKFAAYLRHWLFNLEFLKKLIRGNSLDFIGVNYYSRSLVEARSWGIRGLLLDVCENNHSPLKKNSLGWDVYPQGLHELLRSLGRFKLPIFILENGICTDDDMFRWNFIYQHLACVNLAMREGVKVMGYLYWSLIDNFEWDKGFAPRFGLIDVDYNTYKRTIRESALKFSEVCKTGVLN